MRDEIRMRTTLDLDEDILQAAKDLAAIQKSTAGRVISELVRQALTRLPAKSTLRNGVPLLPPRPGEGLVTLDTVNRLRDDD